MAVHTDDPDTAAAGGSGLVWGLADAVRFLTRLPLPATSRWPDLRAAVGFFPLVGVAVAAVAVAVRAAAGPLLGAPAATVLAVGTAVGVTGALHEDGLADAADGLWGGLTPERRLEIMHDSRLGTFGAATLVLSLLLRVALLAPLGVVGFAQAAVAGHVLGRATALPLTAWLETAGGSRQATWVTGPAARRSTAVAAVTVVVTLGAVAGPWAVVPLALAAAGAGVVGLAARRRLGGITGDVLGAANQVAHLAAMAATVALLRLGALGPGLPWTG